VFKLTNLNFIGLAVIVLLLAVSNRCLAQQEFQFSQTHNFPIAFNAANTGIQPGVNLNAAIRSQWIGINGSPLSQILTIDLPIDYFKSGFGLLITNDQLGASRISKASLTYSYKVFVSKTNFVSLGLNAGINQYALNGEQLLTTDGLYENTINHNDDLLPNTNISSVIPDAGFGLLLKTENLNIGFAANSLIPTQINAPNTASNSIYGVKMQYNAHFLGNFLISNNISLQPSLFLHSDLKEHQLNSMIVAHFNEQFELGVGYRGYTGKSNDALIFLSGIKFWNSFRLTYSYDLNTSALKNVNNGSHELSVGYRFNNLLPSSKRKVIYNPRFL